MMKTAWRSLKRRSHSDKPKPPTPPGPLDSLPDHALRGTPTTSSGTQTFDIETQKSPDPVENTTQEIHKESSQPALDQQSEVSKTTFEPPAHNAPSPKTSIQSTEPSLPVVDSLTASETLWDEAYDTIQKRQLRMVICYEKILSSNLEKTAPDQPPRSPSFEPFENMINQKDYQVRRAQMRELLECWLNSTHEEESLDSNDVESSQLIHSLKDSIGKTDDIEAGQLAPLLKDIIRKAVGTTPPEAVLAWVGACYGSKVLLQPTFANKDDCSGLIYIISRMEWYSDLPKMLAADANSDGRHGELRERIVDLYGAILSYLMKMVCAHFGSLAFDFPNDIFYPRSRGVTLAIVTDAENNLPLFNEEEVKWPLERLLEATRKERTTSTHNIEQPSEENNQLPSDLHMIDPGPGVFNIGVERSQAMQELYQLLLPTEQYKRFRDWDKPENQLLWISGGAGQGKTMLLTGIVQTLSRKTPRESDSRCLAFFFFDYNRPESDNAAAALKNLIWLLIAKQPSLSSYLAKKFSSTGRNHFDSPNDFLALSATFYDMIQDENLLETYFVVDALDECSSDKERPGLDDLLLLITTSMKMSKNIRWLVSSNYSESVELAFKEDGCLHLALGSDFQGSRVAIDNYIRFKISELALVKSYDEELETSIAEALCERSPGNYLWVNIVCTALQAEETWYAISVLDEVKDLNNLELLYSHMKGKIVDLPRQYREFCMEVLSTMAIVHESLHIDELKALVCLAPRVNLRTILQKCSSFLQLQADVVSFLHQSAKDYVRNHVLEPSTISKAHSKLTQRCLDFLGNTPTKKSCTTQDLGRDGATPDNPLAKGNYASLHWMTHLSEILNVTEDVETCRKVYLFLEEHFLAWVEDLVSGGQLSIVAAKLQKVDFLLHIQDDTKADSPNTLQAAIRDAHRFLRLHQSTVSPKDVHAYNTLLFCPKESIIRKTWLPKSLPWVAAAPAMDQHWGRYVNTFRGHKDWIRSIAFSPDGRLIASGSDDSSVRIWDVETGTTQHTLTIERAYIYCVAFSFRGTVAAGSDDNSITLWDSATGRLIKQLPDQSRTVNAICFSENGSKLASASSRDVRIWDLDTYEFNDMEGNSDIARCVDFSRDGKLLAAGSDDTRIRVWDVESRELRQTFNGHSEIITSVRFSPDMKLIASGSEDGTSSIWDADSDTGQRLQTLESEQRRKVNSVAFCPPDGSRLASATDNAIEIWDTKTGDRLQVLRSRSFNIRSVAFSPSGAYLVSGSFDYAVHLWYAAGKAEKEQLSDQLTGGYAVDNMAISPDGRTLAASQSMGTISLWNIETNELLNPEMGFEHDRTVCTTL